MRAAVFGLGYSGLATAITLAKSGYKVIGFDTNKTVISKLLNGDCHIDEPGVKEAVSELISDGSLEICRDHKNNFWPEEMDESMLVFICVGTPQSVRTHLDSYAISSVFNSCRYGLKETEISPHYVFVRSTMAVDTIQNILKEPEKTFASLVVLPEFFQEGKALHDANHPHRLVVGTTTSTLDSLEPHVVDVIEVLANGAPIIPMSFNSAVITKLAANTFLAARIAMVNELAQLCENYDADIRDVVTGISIDPRIGDQYLKHGPGFGGYCLPKDVHALGSQIANNAMHESMVNQIVSSNNNAAHHIISEVKRILEKNGNKGKTITFWGMGFKAGSADTRESPSMKVAQWFSSRNFEVRYYDPNGAQMTHSRGIEYFDPYDSVVDSDLLVVMTHEPEFKEIELNSLMLTMRSRFIYDVTNALDSKQAVDLKFDYTAFGVAEQQMKKR
jgi:UDPglucose 6-dehydrogenase